MNILSKLSHFNGLEFLLIQRPQLWQEIQTILAKAVSGQSVQELFLEAGWQRPQDHNAIQANYFVKDRVALEFQKKKVSSPELYARHLAFYVGDHIDVGVEILPMKSLQQQMSSGVAYYEGELYNVIRQGRGVPAVPLVLIGVGV